MVTMTIGLDMETAILETSTTRFIIVITMIETIIEMIKNMITATIIIKIGKTIELTKTTISEITTVETVSESIYRTKQ